MGLDSNLNGEKYPRNSIVKDQTLATDGFKLESIHLEIGYWRKCYALNSYIGKKWGHGDWNGHEIMMGKDMLEELIEAFKTPLSVAYFAEDISEIERKSVLKTFRKALKWIKQKDPSYYRSVYYRASW